MSSERRGPRGQGDLRPRRGDAVVIQAPAVRIVQAFPPPSGTWLKATRDDWQALVTSPLAGAFLATDAPALWDLYELRDERARALAAYRRHRTVKGAAGQDRVSPYAALAVQLGGEIQTLQKAFGLTPAARAKVSLQFAQAATTTADLQRKVVKDQKSAPRRDPRLEVYGRE